MFVLDTNFFIQGHENHYPQVVFNTLWENIENLIRTEKLIVPVSVYEEINKERTPQYDWVQSLKVAILESEDKRFTGQEQAFYEQQTEVSDFVQNLNSHYLKAVCRNKNANNKQKIIDSFLVGADTDIIVQAKMLNATVVTYEHKSPVHALNKQKILIPNLCQDLGVNCCSPKEMFILLELVY